MIQPMNAEEIRRAEAIAQKLALFSARTDARNPLVAALDGLVKLDPYPACATCPVAFWFYDDSLRCFCKVRKEPTWGSSAKPVRACAEREDLLLDHRPTRA